MSFKFAAIMIAAVALFSGGASAQQARVYKYCLESGPRNFPLLTCNYETMQQCLASKTAPYDRCMINPQWTPGRR
jgi:hypothetical protein